MHDLRLERRAPPDASLRGADAPPLLAGGARKRGPGVAEVALVGAALLAAGFALLGYNVLHGGFMWDDWLWASLSRFPEHQGFFGGTAHQVADFRPLLADWLAGLFKVLGRDAHLHHAVVVVLGALTALSFFALLRALGLPLRHALPIALLSMLFPWSDSTRVYTVNGANNLPVILYLVGVIVSVAGLRRRGASALALALVGAGLYVLSVLTYEVAAVLALCGIGFYRYVAPWRRALPRWVLDLVVVGLAIRQVKSHSPRTLHSLHANLGHARIIVQQGLELLRSALLSFGGAPGIAVAVALIALAAAALVRWRRGALSPADRAAAWRWAKIALASGLAIGAAYAVFIPGDIVYSPGAKGIGNRVNIVAGLGYAALVYAVVMGLVRLAIGDRPWRVGAGAGRAGRSIPLGAALAAVLVLAIGAGYALRTLSDERNLARAADRRARIVDTVKRLEPKPRPTTTLYSFGEPLYVRGGWPIFASAWDLRGALRLAYDDPSVNGRAVRVNTAWICGYLKMAPLRVDILLGRLDLSPYTYAVPYGYAVFVDVTGGHARRIDSRAECRVQSTRFVERQLEQLHRLGPQYTALVRRLQGVRGEALVEAYVSDPRGMRARLGRFLQRADSSPASP